MTEPRSDPRGASPIRFPEELPISAHVREIALAIHEHPVVIVAGETGSGKTTQLPKIALAMGRGLTRRIGVTQPRRIAATSVAARVAEELGCELGREVGYQIRFANKVSPSTYVKFMTDGILLTELKSDPLLERYDTVVLDEAHERTLNIDFLLGALARILPKRPDLKLVVSSATLETERFSAFFGGAPVIQVSGRTFPVETIYRPPRDDEDDLPELVANVVEEITELDRRGDILVFLPGEREIHDVLRALHDHALPHTTLLPLYGRLAQADQKKVFEPARERRIVLATNVAETSLTIPGIVYVIDTGTARVNRYQARSGVTQLLVERVSQASAEQRKGRAGRVESGVCFRLYEESDYAARSPFTDPEILRVGLSGAILQMKMMGIGDMRDFPFVDPPPKRAVDEGYRVLEELGALDEHGALTEVGRGIGRLPLDPRVGRMVLAAEASGALAEILVIASALGLPDPRERPLQQAQAADQAHRRYRDERSDFLGLLKLWRTFRDETRGKTQSQTRAYCKKAFLSYVRMREWADVHEQVRGVATELSLKVNERPADDEAILRAILPGLLSKVGLWNQEHRHYVGARQTKFTLHPSSVLARKPPPWVVVAELVETSQLFGRTAAPVDPKVLAEVGDHLCKRHIGDPYFSERHGEVMAKEETTLFGLPVLRGERVKIAAKYPAVARTVFLREGLVREAWAPSSKPRFMVENQRLMARVRDLRARARMSDMMVDEDALLAFFDKRTPATVVGVRSFEEARAKLEAADPDVFVLGLDDVLLGDATELTQARYPDELAVGAARLRLSYRFDPSEDDDGVTVEVPAVVLPQLDPAVFEWTIPGWHEEKLAQLLFGLPKSLQRTLGVDRPMASLLATELAPFSGPMLTSLVRALRALTGVSVPETAFDLETLPRYLRFTFRVVDDSGATLSQSRDLGELVSRHGGAAKATLGGIDKGSFERIGLTEFPRGGLPEAVPVAYKGGRVDAFPALLSSSRSVDLVLLADRREAERVTADGLVTLLLLALRTSEDALVREVPARIAQSTLADGRQNPRQLIVRRVLGELVLAGGAAPRTPADFESIVRVAKLELSAKLAELSRVFVAIAEPADKARAILKSATGKPGFLRESVEDVRLQLDHLLAPARLASEPLVRLASIPRYLRGVLVRLERLPNGPQKDREKAQVVAPLFKSFVERREALAARGVSPVDLASFGWMLEELRLAVFAPEVGPAMSVSEKRARELWDALARR
jgi:ATP-dependent helicase HrpA